MHSKKLVHRDLKPSNILLKSDPGDSLLTSEIRLADFGLSQKMIDYEPLILCPLQYLHNWCHRSLPWPQEPDVPKQLDPKHSATTSQGKQEEAAAGAGRRLRISNKEHDQPMICNIVVS